MLKNGSKCFIKLKKKRSFALEINLNLERHLQGRYSLTITFKKKINKVHIYMHLISKGGKIFLKFNEKQKTS